MQLTEIHRYPVKSMRGNRLSSSLVDARGLPLDREWLLATPEGQFMTARKHPQLLLWQAQAEDGALQLTTPAGQTFRCHRDEFTETAPATVWKDRFPARCGHHAAEAWLSRQLGMPVRMYWIGEPSQRRLYPQDVPLSFADGAPLLLASQASLADLNSRLEQAVEMPRFRANLIIDGRQAYAEEDWQHIRIGEVCFEHLHPCVRCVMTTVDLDTGEKHPRQEPLATLAKTRGAIFGINLVALNSGTLRVGDAVEVLSFR